jgi:hypothetical protein
MEQVVIQRESPFPDSPYRIVIAGRLRGLPEKRAKPEAERLAAEFPETGGDLLKSMPCYGQVFPFLPTHIRNEGQTPRICPLFCRKPPDGLVC